MSSNEHFLQSQLSGQQLLNTALQGRINEYIRTIGQLEQSRQWLQKENQRLQQELASLKASGVQRTAAPQAGPTGPGAGTAGDQQDGQAQQRRLASWMVSQKAFKQLAIEFGLEKGLTIEAVHRMGLDKKLDVLDSRHDPRHNTNADNSSLIRPHVDALRAEISAELRGETKP